MMELYGIYTNAKPNLGADIEIKPQKMVIGFTQKSRGACECIVLKSELKFWFNLKAGKLNDAKLLTRDDSNVGHWGNRDYEIRVSDTTNLEYIMSPVKQALSY
jgi:predicted transport protein